MTRRKLCQVLHCRTGQNFRVTKWPLFTIQTLSFVNDSFFLGLTSKETNLLACQTFLLVSKNTLTAKSSRRTNSMTFNMAGKFVICYLLRNLEISTICMIWLLNLKNVRLEMFSRSSRRDSEISISYSGKFDW